MSKKVQVAFKWLHVPLGSKHPAVIPHHWLMSLAMDLTALCDVEVKMAPMDAICLVFVKM